MPKNVRPTHTHSEKRANIGFSAVCWSCW